MRPEIMRPPTPTPTVTRAFFVTGGVTGGGTGGGCIGGITGGVTGGAVGGGVVPGSLPVLLDEEDVSPSPEPSNPVEQF